MDQIKLDDFNNRVKEHVLKNWQKQLDFHIKFGDVTVEDIPELFDIDIEEPSAWFVKGGGHMEYACYI